jgi:hypothetical protein
VAGNFIRGIYELDAAVLGKSESGAKSGGRKGDGAELTPWVMAEIKKRQSELKAGKTPAQTLERYKKDADSERKDMKSKMEGLEADKGKAYQEKKEKERVKEMKVLLSNLKKMDLSTVGVEGADTIDAKSEGDGSGAGDAVTGEDGGTGHAAAGGTGMSLGLMDRFSTWFKRGDNKPEEAKDKKPELPIGERLKRALIPVPLSTVDSTQGLTRESAKRDLALLKLNAIPERGAGWELATAPHAGAGLAQSASNAETLAAKMKAGM